MFPKTSHCRMTIKGILEPLLRNLEGAKAPFGALRGKRIPLKKSSCPIFLAKGQDGSIHFLVTPSGEPDRRFARFSLTSLSITFTRCSVASEQTGVFLDLGFANPQDSQLVRPFIGLCEDILFEIEKGEEAPELAAYRTLLRWKRFWKPEVSTMPSLEWLRGLVGELTFLESLISKAGPRAVNAWMGPEGSDHDFVGKGIGVEVKTTGRIPPSVQISGIHQLDPSNFDSLILCVYHFAGEDFGDTLPELVHRIEAKLRGNEDILETFFEKLSMTGYEKLQDHEYSAHSCRLS